MYMTRFIKVWKHTQSPSDCNVRVQKEVYAPIEVLSTPFWEGQRLDPMKKKETEFLTEEESDAILRVPD